MSDSTIPERDDSRLSDASEVDDSHDSRLTVDETIDELASAGPRPMSDVETLDEIDQREVAGYRSAFEKVAPAPEEAHQPSDRLTAGATSIPGPGVPEALAWTGGMLGVHLLGTILAVAVILGVQVANLSASGTAPSPQTLSATLRDLPERFGVELMTGEMLVFLVLAVIAAWIRLGKTAPQRLGMRRIAPHHFWLICAVSIPLSLLCGGLHEGTVAIWNTWFAELPGMYIFDNLNVNESIRPIGEAAPLGLLLLVIAVAPAIGEELVFRGVIGRGLIARYGLFAGVTMTSLLFAAVHLHPAHVVALLPLAFFIHLVYLATRSFLAPMLLHLLNNSLAVVLLKASSSFEGTTLDSESGVSLPVLVIAGGAVLMVGWSLWRSRVEYRLEDGSLWDPGYPTMEIPPASADAAVVYRDCPDRLYRGALGVAGVFSLIFVATLSAMLSGSVSG